MTASSSPDNDLLILVDPQDHEIGVLSKHECHQGKGILHRAFSLFVFNRDGNLLLQQRSADKPLWPLYWSNSCCSHPRLSESIQVASQRRVMEELGFTCAAQYLYKFRYQAQYKNLGSEHELCHVLFGYSDEPVRPNADEVADWRYISPAELTEEINTQAEQFTPWFKMEWQHISDNFLKEILPGPGNSRI